MNEFIRKDDKILLNVPYAEAYFPYDLYSDEDETPSSLAVRYAEGFRIIGIFNIRFFDSDQQPRESAKLRTFSYPNMILTFPTDSTKLKLQLSPEMQPDKYLVLQYYMGDVIMNAEEVQSTSNCTKLLNMITKGKVPNTIPYDQFVSSIWEKNFDINHFDPRVPSITLQMIWSEMCRNPDNMNEPYRFIFGKGGASPYGYATGNMNNVAAATSVFSALSFERIKEKLASSINMTKSGVEQHRSPVEEVLSM